MARKGLLASVTSTVGSASTDSEARSDYTRRGASRSMMSSIDEMAENSKKMAAGEAIISLDTDLIDGSFVSDRVEQDDDDFNRLKEAIQAHGQATPILVRPHPDGRGRYMVVYGHRRLRAARELQIPVRAVVKNMEDIAHVIAQGQENAARANLSFIEKALFAKKLLDMGQGKSTIKAALTIDDTLLSRMLSVTDTIPAAIIEGIGAAKGVGRDRWEELKKLIAIPAKADFAAETVRSEVFLSKEGPDRFSHLLAQVKTGRRAGRKTPSKPAAASWSAPDKRLEASFRNTGKTFSLSLASKDAGGFGEYLSSNLEQLYRAFREAKPATEQGD